MEEKERTPSENKALVKEYPFLRPNIPEEEYDWSWTMLDLVCVGWQRLFLDVCAEIKQHMLDEKMPLDEAYFWDIKEKYGTLRTEFAGGDAAISDMLMDLEIRSMLVCPQCGKRTKYISRGYILYLCPDCAKEVHMDCDVLTPNDIPVLHKYIRDENGKTTELKEYPHKEEFEAQWDGGR